MVIALIIGFAANIVWILIPLRQIRTNYFYFFLVNALTALIVLLDRYTLLIHPANFYLGQGFFLILALYKFQKIPSHILLIISVLIISVVLPFFLSIQTITIFLIIERLIVFLIILKRVIFYISKNLKLNLFHFILLLHELLVITRFIIVTRDERTGILLFYISGTVGIIIGILFLFYNEKNSPKLSIEKTQTI